ncbi:CGNR zinc finger domain-containing protein [Paenibacillus vini]|uniref:CGNR zinc finger domain-containing protein n=1 Tax=Paenibacillus vini TaxID=1476024 RepID=UPI0025B71FB6|nr:CGNR zinc finger domain-containing protein [Paenibacillus vini]MDN4067321.1 CGNR zinc finger domain-containing protein [Paenibacillus vini]
METLWSDFLNSEWHDWKGSGYSEDRLGQEKWQTYYLNQWQLKAQLPADDETVGVMRQFRSRLHDMSVRCAAGATLAAEDVNELNRMLDLGPVKRKAKLEGGELGIGLTPVREDWHQVMAEVAASFLQSLIEGEGGRIRICDNPDCRWVFYDDTRNRTKKYCDDKTCGNLMKVRRFRAKKKQEQGRTQDSEQEK